ncbi:hypothetical protein TWF481_002760 [Arthrobotrys musiformis]|uniref:Uncharacterized protein n=1 Tax=Arthrobotrys musiformis TaxID=47236 RepID=A0AAV9VRC2_9PEZI
MAMSRFEATSHPNADDESFGSSADDTLITYIYNYAVSDEAANSNADYEGPSIVNESQHDLEASRSPENKISSVRQS